MRASFGAPRLLGRLVSRDRDEDADRAAADIYIWPQSTSRRVLITRAVNLGEHRSAAFVNRTSHRNPVKTWLQNIRAMRWALHQRRLGAHRDVAIETGDTGQVLADELVREAGVVDHLLEDKLAVGIGMREVLETILSFGPGPSNGQHCRIEVDGSETPTYAIRVGKVDERA